MTDAIRDYWRAFVATLPGPAPECQAWSFGNTPEMADRLGALVVSGRKRATASLGWVYDDPAELRPTLGAHSIILDGAGQPLCIIETTAVDTRAFADVDAAFAAREGEGDGSLAYWRRVHWAFFASECAALGREPAESMPVVCESFRVVYPTA